MPTGRERSHLGSKGCDIRNVSVAFTTHREEPPIPRRECLSYVGPQLGQGSVSMRLVRVIRVFTMIKGLDRAPSRRLRASRPRWDRSTTAPRWIAKFERGGGADAGAGRGYDLLSKPPKR